MDELGARSLGEGRDCRLVGTWRWENVGAQEPAESNCAPTVGIHVVQYLLESVHVDAVGEKGHQELGRWWIARGCEEAEDNFVPCIRG